MNPDELRKEAAEAEAMARVVSFQADKDWLGAKAAELRRLADRIESRPRAAIQPAAPPPPRSRRRWLRP